MKTPPGHERRRNAVKGLKYLGFSQMLQKVSGHNRGKLSRTLRQYLVIVAFPDTIQACRPRDSDLLRAHVDAHGVVAVGEQEPQQITLPAAYVDDWSRSGLGRAGRMSRL